MKRNILLLGISIILCPALMSQSLSLKYGDELVTNDSIYITGEPTDDLMEWHLKVKNNTDKEIEVKVRKNEISLVEGTVNTFCWGSCFMPTVYTSPTPIKIAANSTDFNSFAGDYEPTGMEGTSIISYTFFNVSDEADSVMVTAFYQAGSSGLKYIADGDKNIRIYPNPVSEEINIEFSEDTGKPFTIRIVDLDGKVEKEMRIEASEKRITIPADGIRSTSAILLIIDEKNVIAVKKLIFR